MENNINIDENKEEVVISETKEEVLEAASDFVYELLSLWNQRVEKVSVLDNCISIEEFCEYLKNKTK